MSIFDGIFDEGALNRAFARLASLQPDRARQAERVEQAAMLEAAQVPDGLVAVMCKIASSARVTSDDLTLMAASGIALKLGAYGSTPDRTPSVTAIATIAALALREAADQLDAYDAENQPPTDDRWTCDLGYYGEAAWLRDRAERLLAERPRRPQVARGYTIEPSPRGGRSVCIDGVEVPYCLAAPGPRIEARGAGLSILWLPVFVESEAPDVGPSPESALLVDEHATQSADSRAKGL